jgi:hypothetical protein
VTAERSYAEQLAARAATRYARWDGALWEELVRGPAHVLVQGLAERSDEDTTLATRLTESFLDLLGEAVGQGYLYPARSSGRTSLFTRAFTDLIPRLLPATPANERGAVLARWWNVCENLEHEPRWLTTVFLQESASLDRLDELEALCARVSTRVFEPPAGKIDANPRTVWLDLGAYEWRFLPGLVQFVTPNVACIADRLNPSTDHRLRAGVGVLLSDEPLILGPIPTAAPHRRRPGRSKVWQQLAARDPRFDDVHDSASNAARGVATLTTSQHAVLLLPQEAS